MKLKFYVTLFSLFVIVSVSQGQYSIWKPVHSPALPTSKGGFGTFARTYTASDNSNLYFLVNIDLVNSATLVKLDSQNSTFIDGISIPSTILMNQIEETGMIVYRNDIFLFDKGQSGFPADTFWNPMQKLDTNKSFNPVIDFLLPDIQNNTVQISNAIVFKDKMYIMGGMRAIDNLKCSGIAMYDGNSWSTLDTGVNEGFPTGVHAVPGAFKIYNDKLYILAYYGDSISSYNFISCWDGNKWLFKKKIVSDSLEFLYSLDVVNNKLYASSSFGITFNLYEVNDSLVSDSPQIIIYDFSWPISNINNQIWTNAAGSVNIIDSNSSCLAPQYYIPGYTVNTGYTEFKDKIYAYGDFELINGNGDTLRYIAQTNMKPNKISGQVFYSKDSNCNYTLGDTLAQNWLVKINPGPIYMSTDKNGIYKLMLGGDTVEIESVLKKNFKLNSCSPNKYIVYANDTAKHTSLNFSIGIANTVNDFSVKTEGATGWRARRGFTESYVVHVRNEGTEKDSGKVRLYYNDKFEIKNTKPAADSITSTWAEWTVPTLDLFGEYNIHVDGRIDTSMHNDDTLVLASQISLVNDYDISDNTDTLLQKIVSSIDPNIIVAFPQGNDSMNLVFPTHKQLEYLIHFQNDGTDTAYNISVIDTLGENLDVSKFEIISSSHKMDYKILPYDQQTNKHFIKFNFDNILLAPTDSNNKNQTDNGGFVSYKIQLKNNLPIGTEITNRAYIFFDYNSAVETNTAIVRIDTTIANGIYNTKFYIYEGLYYWPVPASENLNIKNMLNEKQQLELYNIEGKKLMSLTLQQNETIQIGLEKFSAGMYFIRSLTNGEVYKLVKE